MPLPPTVNVWTHNEDIDTSGGAAAVAAALIGGERGHTLVGTDQIKVPSGGVRYLGFQSTDETIATLDADGYFTIGAKRRFDIPFNAAQCDITTEAWFPGGMLCNAEDLIDYVGRSSGAGAEQHTLTHFVDQPSIGEPWTIRSPVGASCYLTVELVSAALVAQTASGWTDICGRTTAYPNAQAKIPNDKNIGVCLYAITPILTAGYSAIGLRTPSESRNLMFVGDAAGTAVGKAKRIDLTQVFGGGLYCTADRPIMFGGLGVGTTAVGALAEIAIFGTGPDG